MDKNKGFIIIYERKIFLDLLSNGVKPLSRHEGSYREYVYEFNESTYELIERIYKKNYEEGHIKSVWLFLLGGNDN